MSGDYQVGYKKPPKHTRFKKGRSGNPKGRPKGAKSIWAGFEAVFWQKVTIHEGGRRRRVRAPQALAMRLLEKALNGNMTAMKTVIDLLPGNPMPNEASASPPLTFKDDSAREKLLRRFDRLAAARTQRMAEAESNGSAPGEPPGRQVPDNKDGEQ